jgi:alpha-L-fucosidase
LQRVRKFAIEYWQDEQWRPCYRGENLGASLAATFDPVTAQRVRLNITEATDGPTIWEFELFPPK